MPESNTRRTPGYRPLFAWFCAFALVWTTLLLFAGGFTTSIQAGMAFLDWPLSNGSINPEGWLTEADMRAEHSHRLLGTIVGLLTLTIALWAHLRDDRAWVRRLSLIAALLVVAQGILGGLRVKLDVLNTGWESNIVAQTFRVVHGCVAQVFLCILVAITISSTRRWIEHHGGLQREPSSRLRVAGIVACTAVFIQLILGAVMRHNMAGLAIPTFPLTPENTLIPSHWDFRVGIHFAHRAWAVVVTVAILWFVGRLWAARHLGRVLSAGAIGLTALLALQVYLGALVVWTVRNPHAATIHMLTGAFVLASSWGLTFLTHRFRFADARSTRAVAGAPTGTPAIIRA